MVHTLHTNASNTIKTHLYHHLHYHPGPLQIIIGKHKTMHDLDIATELSYMNGFVKRVYHTFNFSMLMITIISCIGWAIDLKINPKQL